jgi:hypothetical protein
MQALFRLDACTNDLYPMTALSAPKPEELLLEWVIADDQPLPDGA